MIDPEQLFDALRTGDVVRLQRWIVEDQTLREKRPANRFSLLVHAVALNPDLVPWLLDQGISADQQDSVGGTAMMYACANGKTTVAECLIARGADVDVRNDAGETAFSYSCTNNEIECAARLHAAGADINSVDSGGGSPLDWAGCWADYSFYEWLIGIGCRHASGGPREPGSPAPFQRER